MCICIEGLCKVCVVHVKGGSGMCKGGCTLNVCACVCAHVYVCVYVLCMYVLCECSVQRQEEFINLPGTGVIGSCAMHADTGIQT